MKYRIIPIVGDSGGIHPSGTLNITSNDVTVDVTQYKYVDVNIPFTIPEVSRISITDITYNSAVYTCTIEDGNKPITDSYLEWRTEDDPTDNHTIQFDAVVGANSISMTDLPSSTRIAVTPHVTNIIGEYNLATSYFQTEAIPATVPIVSITGKMDITSDSAKVAYNIDSDGGDTVTSRGVCYSTSQNPTINDSVIYGVTSNEWLTLSNLTPNTTYYIKAFAENSVGVGYSSEDSFNTEAAIDYFYLKNEDTTAGNFVITGSNLSTLLDQLSLEVSTNNGITWTSIDGSYLSSPITVIVQPNQKVLIRNSSGDLSSNSSSYVIFNISNTQFSAGGDIRTLMDYTNYENITQTGLYSFYNLFYNTYINDVSNLKMAPTIYGAALNCMFSGTTYLINGLDLSNCSYRRYSTSDFREMYYGSSVTTIVLPQTYQVSYINRIWSGVTAASGIVYRPANYTIPSVSLPTGWTYDTY